MVVHFFRVRQEAHWEANSRGLIHISQRSPDTGQMHGSYQRPDIRLVLNDSL